MRDPRRLRAVLAMSAVACSLIVAVAPAHAAGDAIGGAALESRGTVVAPGAPPLPGGLSAVAWIVADLDTGEVLAARDPHGRYAPASTLKMLTALTLIPVLPPDRKVTAVFDDVAVDGSKVGLVERVGYPVSELARAMMMVSANDAAMALARSADGVPHAVDLMNQQAVRLQARDTRAVNPSGLDAEGQLSSPYDLALIARAGMGLPAFRQYVQTRRSSVSGPGGRRIETYNHNRLLRNYDGAIGIKNGYTIRARASFVGAATRGERTLVAAAMRGNPDVWRDVAKLLDWGFLAAGRPVTPVGDLVDPLPTAVASSPAPTDSTQVATAPTPAAVALDAAPSGPLPGAIGVEVDRPLAAVLPATLLAAGALATGLVLRRQQISRRRPQHRPLPRS